MVEEADHVVLEGISALIIAETLLMPRVDGLQGVYSGAYGETVAGVCKRIDRSIDSVRNAGIHDKTARVAQGRGTEDRQHHIGSGAGPPVAKGLAEILLMPFQTETGGRIEQAAEAQGAVRHETTQSLHGLRPLQLEQAVGEVPDLPEV